MEPDVRKYEELQNNTDRHYTDRYAETAQVSNVDDSTERMQWNDNADEYGLS